MSTKNDSIPLEQNERLLEEDSNVDLSKRIGSSENNDGVSVNIITPTAKSKHERLDALDVARGVIIAIMALDHASGLSGAKNQEGELWANQKIQLNDFSFHGIASFVMRFVTHICMIGFVFMMGFGLVYLFQSRLNKGWTLKQVVKHLIIRGLLLVFLQFAWEDTAWNVSGFVNTSLSFGVGLSWWLLFGTLQMLGWCMVLCTGYLALDIKLEERGRPKLGSIIMIVSIFVCFLTTTLTCHFADKSTIGDPVSNVLLLPTLVTSVSFIFVADSILPWMQIALLGCLFGKYFTSKTNGKTTDEKFRVFLWGGLIFWLIFAVVRPLGVGVGFWFGNFRLPEWNGAGEFIGALFTLSKYPPDLGYISLFLGFDFLMIWVFYKTKFEKFAVGKILLVFGQSSLFFYLCHLWVYLVLGGLFSRATSGTPPWYSLPLWIVGLDILYPLCERWSNFKKSTSYDSIWRLF